MFQGLVFALAVMGIVLKCGYELEELSLMTVILILAAWLTLVGIVVATNSPAVVVAVGTIVITIGLVLKVFGGDIRI